jgi:hypothetical protein
MAVSKSTRRHTDDTRRRIQTLFRNSRVSEERRRAWYTATAHLEAGVAGLRFPVYEDLYNLNLHAQKLADLVGEISAKLSRPTEDVLYHQHLIQQIRSAVTSDVLDQMGDIEHIEGWLSESLRRSEERKLRDPEDIYLMVREQEEERARDGNPPRIRFLDDTSTATAQTRVASAKITADEQSSKRTVQKTRKNRHG